MRIVPTRRLLVFSLTGTVGCLGVGIAAWALASPSGPSTSSGVSAGTSTTAADGIGTSSSSSMSPTDSVVGSGTGSVTGSTVVPVSTSTTSTTTSIVQPGGTLVLTQSSAGQSFIVHPRQRLEVILPGTGQQYHGYTIPQSGDQNVVSPDGAACGAPSGEFCTSYAGVGAGDTRLTSTSDPACRQASPPCEAASAVWWVDIKVA